MPGRSSSDQNANLNAARQAAVATLNSEIPNSAVFFYNNDLIDPSLSRGYHFNEPAENYLEIGWRMGQAALDQGYVTRAIPEPATFALIVMGAVGLLSRRRRAS